ncbi:hypothetical protein HHI36_003302 [Cryptolaemus montrouzieri]|uniref:Uncharacterized protein n=1 Tax=Cryptolaemus montrouzieri TaxID=559131 RepID=A0ABD2PD74_9CUCU
MICKCNFCQHSYHSNKVCRDLSREQADVFRTTAGAKWFCQDCRACSEDNGTGDDAPSSSQVRTSMSDNRQTSQIDPISNVSLQKKLQLLRESVEFCGGKVSDFENTLKKLIDYMKLTDMLKNENQKLKSEMLEMNEKN